MGIFHLRVIIVAPYSLGLLYMDIGGVNIYEASTLYQVAEFVVS